MDALGFNTFRGFDTNNNMVYQANHLNQTNWFTYSTNSLLLATTNALGHTNVFSYDTYGNLLTNIDALGRTTISQYDSAGNLTNTLDALANPTTYLYANGLIVSQKDALGTIITNQYDSAGNLTNSRTLNSQLITLNSTSYGYDANGNRTSQTTMRTLASGTVTNETTTFIYDAQNRLIHTIDPGGKTNSVVYNALGQQEATIDKLGRNTSYEYDTQGRLVRTMYSDGTSESSAYDAEGRRTNSVDRGGRATAFFFDKLGRLSQTILPDGATNRTIFDEVGHVRFIVDVRGTTNAFGIDAAGRRTSVTNAWGTAVQQVMRYAFDAFGNQTNVVDALGRATDYEYDALNRRTKTIFPATATGGQRPFTTLGYDVLGRRIAETNEAGIVARFGYDPLSRLIGVTNAFGTAHAMWATYRYDEAGNQTAQTNALNRVTKFEFDAFGRRLKRIMPMGQVETLEYYIAGNLVAHTNFNGLVVTNHHDGMSRLSRKHNGTNGAILESYTYTPTGQRASRTDQSGSYAWNYDVRDRMTAAFTPNGNLYYAYDRNGNLTNLQSSTINGVWLAFEYDALNRLTNVIDKRLNGGNNTRYNFDAVGNLVALAYPTGVTNQWQHDARNRLTNQVWKLKTTKLANFYYRLGVAGNRTNLTDTVNGSARTYDWAYDALYRLTNEVISGSAPSGAITYRYEVVGNRTNRTSTLNGITNQSFTFNANDWLGTDVYDSNGNTRTNANNVYLYDYANRLTNANDGIVIIVYDGNGNRVKKIAGGITTLYLVDERNLTGYAQILEELSVSGGNSNLSKVYTYGLDLISQRESNGTVYFFGYDGHGSTRLLMSSTGAIADTFAYDAYGILIASNGPPLTAYLYAGEHWDAAIGQYYVRRRTWSPETGRFLTSDPCEGLQSDPLSLHKYLYAHANPVNMIDPSGELTMHELMVNGLTIVRTGAQVAVRVYAGYDRAMWVRDGIIILGKFAATGTVDPIALTMFAQEFIPFGKAFRRISVFGNKVRGASPFLNEVFGVMIKGVGRTKDYVRQIGELGAATTARALKMRPTNFIPGYHGIDDIYEKGGKLVIVEAKGGTSALKPPQMSQKWINDKIEELQNVDLDWHKRLKHARDNGNLQGIVVRTKTDGNMVLDPEFELKDWSQIGSSSF